MRVSVTLSRNLRKKTNLNKRLQKQEERDAKKSTGKGFDLDELSANAIDLLDVIINAKENDINNVIDKIFEFCNNWASEQGLSYDVAFIASAQIFAVVQAD